MRAQRSRTKKLTVAFHFQFANQAAWKCDMCRARGLEARRRCGWLAAAPRAEQVIWARKRISVENCPISYISAESIALLEEFHVWKLFGTADVYRLPARLVEAIFLLERELRLESKDAQD